MFSLALEENCVDELFEAVVTVSDVLRANEDFGAMLNHPKIIKEDKVKMVEDSFSSRVPKEIVGIMTLMVSKGRVSDILPMFDYFIGLVKEEKKIGKAKVTTAIPLSDAQKGKIEKKLLDTTKYEQFEIEYQVDETLIGGMVIRIGDRVVDSSIKTKLYDLSRELRNIQV